MNAPLARQPDPSPTVAAFLKRSPRLLINGEWIDAGSRKRLPVIDPSTANKVSEIAEATQADVDAAVAAARKAFESGPWHEMRPVERQALLLKLADLIEKNADEMAELESIDNGKTKFMASIVDIPGAIEQLRYFAGWATKIEGQSLDISYGAIPGGKFHAYTKREPIGVCGQIVPWNFPLVMATMKLGPALAVGCTSVLKPAEQTSMTALRLGELIVEAGYPAGVVNILTGLGETVGAALVAHPDIDKIAFTGSTEVGKLINRNASETLKRVSLELGGKSPVMILPDVDPAMVTPGVTQAMFFNHGQVCCAGTRLLAHKAVFDQVLEGVVGAASSMPLGPSLDPGTMMGPLVSEEQQARVLGYIESGKKQGASLVTGGDAPQSDGYFVNPTVMVDVKPDMKVYREEIFGPVLVAQRFDDLDEMVAAANDTPYGLGASIWSNNLSAVHRLIPRIKSGNVWVNSHSILDPNMPFGGAKQSGFGRELGRAGVEMYTELKSVVIAV
jgi:phenylacetaldehyde dehydrogenase